MAIDVITAVVAYQRVSRAKLLAEMPQSEEAKALLRAGASAGSAEKVVADHLKQLATVTDLLALRLTAEEWRTVDAETRTILQANANAILDGFGDATRLRLLNERVTAEQVGLRTLLRLPCGLDQLKKRTSKKRKELGRDPLLSELGPSEPAFTSEKSIREEVARRVGMSNESAVRNLARETSSIERATRVLVTLPQRSPRSRKSQGAKV